MDHIRWTKQKKLVISDALFESPVQSKEGFIFVPLSHNPDIEMSK